MKFKVSGGVEREWEKGPLGTAQTKWYKWFAWYPVCVGQVDTEQLDYPFFKKVYQWVWLDYVLRRDKYYPPSYFGSSYIKTEMIRYD